MAPSDIFFLAESGDDGPARSALELASGGRQLAEQAGGADVVALAYGPGARDAVAALGRHGASHAVVLGDSNAPAVTFAPAAAQAIRQRGGGTALLAPAVPNGRDIAAALVGLLDLPALGPVRAVEIADGRVRVEQVTLGGTFITRSEAIGDGPAIVLVATNTFTPTESAAAEVQVADAAAAADGGGLGSVRVVESQQEAAGTVVLEEATTVIAGGRGLGSAEGFEMLRELAAVLGGAVGATRAAADAGWIPFQLQIGQTGKTVKPSLYLAVGISGAIQHRVGMQGAENVVAINRDPDAPIADFADLFVIGDLFAILPKLIEEIRRRKEG